MNRRSFLETLAKASAGFTILPAATTYGRVWRAQRRLDYTCVFLPDVNQYGDLGGIYGILKRCGEVVAVPPPSEEEKAFFNTLFMNKPIPRHLRTKIITEWYSQ